MKSGIIGRQSLKEFKLVETFDELQNRQNKWLSRYSKLRGPEYIWPEDALLNWSRFVEYPFFWKALKDIEDLSNKTVLDIGPGVTFFTEMIASKCSKLISVDIDPSIVKELNKMTETLGIDNAECVLTTDKNYKTRMYDIVTCLSVLEHTEDPVLEFENMTKLVSSGGTIVISFDINENDNRNDGLTSEQFSRIQRVIATDFEYVYPLIIRPKNEILTTENSDFPLYSGNFYWIKEIVYSILKRPSNSVKLSCFIAVIKKK
jgi:2-polyprenyl-3-methyl-5-hydroxy-6-metoxy-1,4-benzoquinol methylase